MNDEARLSRRIGELEAKVAALEAIIARAQRFCSRPLACLPARPTEGDDE